MYGLLEPSYGPPLWRPSSIGGGPSQPIPDQAGPGSDGMVSDPRALFVARRPG